jgi:5-deoxy-glucuronate isomerase
LTVITPRGDAYRGAHVQLDVLHFEPGSMATIAVPDGIEAALVLLTGSVDLAGRRATRDDVFGGPATAVYLPPGTSVEMSTSTAASLALAATVGDDLHAPQDAAPVFVTPSGVVVHERGRPGWQRQVHDVIAATVPAQRLLVGETFNTAGQWSSFPPHKHDGGNGEPALEEVYYYRFDRPEGFGFQGLYEHAEPGRDGREQAIFLRHGAVVGIPRGYHPVCAAPGYRLYYLWALSAAAGTPRALALHEDPAYRWLHDLS